MLENVTPPILDASIKSDAVPEIAIVKVSCVDAAVQAAPISIDAKSQYEPPYIKRSINLVYTLARKC